MRQLPGLGTEPPGMSAGSQNSPGAPHGSWGTGQSPQKGVNWVVGITGPGLRPVMILPNTP